MRSRYRLFIPVFAFIVLGFTVLFLLFPYLCDIYLLPSLLTGLPASEKHASLSRISPWEVRGTITIADQGRPSISIPRFELQYSPLEIFRGQATSLTINSATLHMDLREGQPTVHGLPASRQEATDQQKHTVLTMPIAIASINVQDLNLVIHLNDKQTIDLKTDGRFLLGYSEDLSGKKVLSSLEGQFHTTGDLEMTGSAKFSTTTDGYGIELTAEPVDIGQLIPLLPALHNMQAAGKASIDNRARLDGQFHLTEHETTVRVTGLKVASDILAIENASPERPASLSLTGNLTRSYYKISNILINRPEKVLFNAEGEAKLKDGLFSGRAMLDVKRTQTPVTIDFTGTAAPSATTIDYHIHSQTASLGEHSITLSPVTANGVINVGGTATSGNIEVKIDRITDPASGITLVGTSLQLPFVLPLHNNNRGAEGRLAIEKIHYKNTYSARLQAILKPSSDGISFTSQLSTPFADGLKLACNGSAGLEKTLTLACKVPAARIDTSALLPYIAIKNDFSFDGKVSADATYSIERGLQQGRLSLGFHEGNLHFGKTALENINLEVEFPWLPMPRSSPNQVCTIGSVQAGRLRMTDGRISFRVEDESTIFLEKSRFTWCGGKVEAASLNISSKMEELDTTLYCDRVKFTELLYQLGIEGAEGKGSLNGRLPLTVSAKGVRVDDGFLFSTPGDGGIVRFNNTQQLRQGIPNINQSAYLDYSMQALENFSYNWTKLTFNSDSRELLIAIQLDGKPAEPLPFAYKNGEIVPSVKGSGISHPIRLDLNFRLPLQEILQYGRDFQSIMENM